MQNSSHGLTLSLVLHGSVAALVVFLTVVEPFKKKKPIVFEMIVRPPSTVGTPSDGGRSAAPPSTDQFKLPEPPPPVRNPEKAARPAPVTPPVKTPAPPKPEPKPAPPKTTPKPAEPPKVSYQQFLDKHGKPKAPTQNTSKPKPVTVPRIDAGNLRDVLVGGSNTDSLSVAQQSALENYIARLKEALLNIWNKPAGLAQTTEADVQFDIAASGRLSGMRIVKSSGHAQFDASVIESFRNLATAGAPPDGGPVTLRLTFRMRDE